MAQPIRVLYASSKDTDMVYAARAHVHDPFYYFEWLDHKVVFLDNRDYAAFKEECRPGIEVVLHGKELDERTDEFRGQHPELRNHEALALVYLAYLAETYGAAGRELLVNETFPLPLADFLREEGYEVKVSFPFFPQRLLKDEEARQALREANKTAGLAFEFIEQTLAASTIRNGQIWFQDNVLTSEWLRREVEVLMIRHGMSFPEGMIISSGPQAANPHHVGAGPLLPYQPVICDLFPRDVKTGYYADITRTYFKGEPGPDIRRMYETVLDVQESQLSMLKAGVPAREVHLHGCRMFEGAGYDVLPDQGFCHGTGHGLGLDLHEPTADPLRMNKNSSLILEAGHCMTVEPGLYYEHRRWGGVRIEDDVIITPDGYENLTTLDKALKVF